MVLTENEANDELKKYEPSKSENKINIIISFYYIIIFIFIGIPTWCYTTTTYRAALPSSDMSTLIQSKITNSIEVDLIDLFNYVNFHDMALLEERIFNEIRKQLTLKDAYLQHNFDGHIRPATKKEIESFIEFGNSSRKSFEKNIQFNNKGGVTILLLPYNNIIPKNKKALITEFDGNNLLYINGIEDEKTIVNIIIKVLRKSLVQHSQLKEIVRYARGESILQTSSSSFNRNQLKSKANYDITFTLIVPYPTSQSALKPEWNFNQLYQQYIDPLISQLQSFININIDSQILYGFRIEKMWTPTYQNNFMVYKSGVLTHIINGVERFINSNSDLNFVAYLSSDKFKFDKDSSNRIGTQNKTNNQIESFLIPQWGGFVFVNDLNNKSNDSSMMMHVFEMHLRKLLGIPSELDSLILNDAQIAFDSVQSTNSILSSWQLNMWLRQKFVENIAIVQKTLASVESLLHKVVNMVIRDDVADSISKATRLALSANHIPFQHPCNCSLHDSMIESRDALKAAEYAFFHPSLLELLYFAEDQKFGIYIPLTIPLILPLLLSVNKIIRFFKSLKSDKLKTS